MKRIVSLKRVSIVADLALGFMLRFVCGPSTTSFYGNPNQCLSSPSLQKKKRSCVSSHLSPSFVSVTGVVNDKSINAYCTTPTASSKVTD
ncbi:hypothetical protein F2Q68_00031275 [Brassica cretica]|uniref:Secreted protein n=1 Tax=Brassica cretica TaxID=69181 RepID=A0A8S9G831_BRACR|nr:hypothetical protein F2Q68_00031275 [Brassica cretica]